MKPNDINNIMKSRSKSPIRHRRTIRRHLRRPPTAALLQESAKTATGTLEPQTLRKIDAWWRAANYLSVGQTYLYDNPLLRRPLKKEHVKPRLVGHWGTTPG